MKPARKRGRPPTAVALGWKNRPEALANLLDQWRADLPTPAPFNKGLMTARRAWGRRGERVIVEALRESLEDASELSEKLRDAIETLFGRRIAVQEDRLALARKLRAARSLAPWAKAWPAASVDTVYHFILADAAASLRKTTGREPSFAEVYAQVRTHGRFKMVTEAHLRRSWARIRIF